MTRLIYTACAIILCLDAPTKANPPEAHLPEIHREFFNAYCLDCHNSDAQEGKVDLETLSFHITTVEQAERWQKVLNTINAGEMPPEDSEQP
ncbi:MAG: c-type cytochrome domain-containing protein, partial [Rubripirellula sp.]